jgi:hypothetical protein
VNVAAPDPAASDRSARPGRPERPARRGGSARPDRPDHPTPPAGTPGLPATGRAPGLVLAVVGLVLAQALVLVVAAVGMLVALVRGSQLAGPVLFLVVLAAGLAALLVAAGRALLHGRRWARSPVMTWQILLVVLSVGWIGSEAGPWAVGVLVVAAAVGVGLLLPPVVAWTTASTATSGDGADRA